MIGAMAVDVPPREEPTAGGLIAERAYLALHERIVTLQLPPGTTLREDALMAELAIGRTPLREAIKRLALEGLVAVQPRRGTYVTEIESADIIHITEVRAELEGYAAELAARRMDADAGRVAGDLLDDIEQLGRSTDQEALMRLDRRIHSFVWQATGNPYLINSLERYFSLSLRIWYLVLERVPGLGHAVHEQVALLDALAAHDARRARQIMREHVLAFQHEIMAAFSSG
jgi:DNA-binding GntR family transcriptional regulator